MLNRAGVTIDHKPHKTRFQGTANVYKLDDGLIRVDVLEFLINGHKANYDLATSKVKQELRDLFIAAALEKP